MKAVWLLLHLNQFGESGLELVKNESTLRGGFAAFNPDQCLSVGGVVIQALPVTLKVHMTGAGWEKMEMAALSVV